MVVYLVKNEVNGKVYVGLTTIEKPQYRWTQHVNSANRGDSGLLQRAITKYGDESFTFSVIDKCIDFDELCEREKYWISVYDSTCKNKGYNLAAGGQGALGVERSEETREKMSQAKQGAKHFRFGRQLSNEHKMKISQSHKGKVHSEESRRKMSVAKRGKKLKPRVEYTIKNHSSGESFVITRLKEFCTENSLDYSSLFKTLRGTLNKHKGWTIIEKKELED